MSVFGWSRGSLEGVEGVLTRKKNLYRLVLSVEMLAQSVSVEIDALDVVPVVQRSVVGCTRKVNNDFGFFQRQQFVGWRLRI